MKRNPYTLLFGKAPSEIISRMQTENEIIESFSATDCDDYGCKRRRKDRFYDQCSKPTQKR